MTDRTHADVGFKVRAIVDDAIAELVLSDFPSGENGRLRYAVFAAVVSVAPFWAAHRCNQRCCIKWPLQLVSAKVPLRETRPIQTA